MSRHAQAGTGEFLEALWKKALTLLNVVVRQGAAVLQLLSGEDETLLVWGNACGCLQREREEVCEKATVAALLLHAHTFMHTGNGARTASLELSCPLTHSPSLS